MTAANEKENSNFYNFAKSHPQLIPIWLLLLIYFPQWLIRELIFSRSHLSIHYSPDHLFSHHFHFVPFPPNFWRNFSNLLFTNVEILFAPLVLYTLKFASDVEGFLFVLMYNLTFSYLPFLITVVFHGKHVFLDTIEDVNILKFFSVHPGDHFQRFALLLNLLVPIPFLLFYNVV